jgi:hypothetical protein
VVEKVSKALAPKAGINEIKLASKDTGYIEDLNSFTAIGQ